MTETEGDERAVPAGEMDTGRVLALSDGVFAIAATLLVLDLRLPEGVTVEELPTRLHELLPAAGGRAGSYVPIRLIWLGDHKQFRNLSHDILPLVQINLVVPGSDDDVPIVAAPVRYHAPGGAPV